MSTKNDPKTAASHSLSSLQFLDRTLVERCYFFSVLRSCRGTREASVRRAQKTRHACQGKCWKKMSLPLSSRLPRVHRGFSSLSLRVRLALTSRSPCDCLHLSEFSFQVFKPRYQSTKLRTHVHSRRSYL